VLGSLILYHLQDPAAFNCVSIVLDTVDTDHPDIYHITYVAWADFANRYGWEVHLDKMGRMKWHLVPHNPARFFRTSKVLHQTVCPVGPKGTTLHRIDMPMVGQRFVDMWRELLRQIHDDNYISNLKCECCGLVMDGDRLCPFCLMPLHIKCASSILGGILDSAGYDELLRCDAELHSPGNNTEWLTCDFTAPPCSPGKTAPGWCALCSIWIGVGFAESARLKHNSDAASAAFDKDEAVNPLPRKCS
jgi:hypothetical protein